jgi:hypothetical protein
MTYDSWAGALAIASIAFACAVYYTATAWFTHRERMAKIEKGIDPDKKANLGADSDRDYDRCRGGFLRSSQGIHPS